MERLEQVLAAFGSDPARWPADDRARLAAVISESAAARQRVAEAAALDQVLDAGGARAPAASEARVRDRLFAALDEEQTSAVPSATVVPFHRPAAAAVRTARPAVAPRGAWREAMLLAAALLLGVFAGTQGILNESGVVIPGLTDGVTSSDDVSDLALGTQGLGVDTLGGVGFTDGEEELL